MTVCVTIFSFVHAVYSPSRAAAANNPSQTLRFVVMSLLLLKKVGRWIMNPDGIITFIAHASSHFSLTRQTSCM